MLGVLDAEHLERYFDFVQRAVEVNRGLTVRWAQAVTALSGAVQDRAESAGQAARNRTKPVGHTVRTKADTAEQAAREQSAKTATASRKQAEQAQQDRAREARRVERERVRQARQQARARYERMTKAELSDLPTKQDLPKSGNVDELVERLVEADAR